MRSIAYITIFALLVSCEKNISSEFAEDAGNWFALSGLITGGEVPTLHISETVNLVQLDSLKLVNDATVEGRISKQPVLFTAASNGVYTCEEVIVKPGDSVSITCSGRDLPEATAALKVPGLPQVSDLAWYIDEEYVLHIEAMLTDPAGQADYYSIRATGIKQYTESIHTADSVYYVEHLAEGYYHGYNFPDSLALYSTRSGRSFSDNSERMINSGQIIYFTDKQFDGTTQHLNLEYALWNTWNDSIPDLTVHIAKNDMHLFNYIKSVIRYNPEPDIPIMQPVSVYTNVENGFGLLTAESKITKVIDLADVYSDPGFLAYRDSVRSKK